MTHTKGIGGVSMEDRFKFRVFISDKKNSKNSLTGMFKVHSLHTGTNKAIITSLYGNCSIKLENNILMQCTGLKDYNGELIYEGDVVRLKAKNGMTFDYAVKYKNYCFILEYINGKLKGTKARNFAKQYAQPQKMYEHGYMVIGNIYENPELLED